MEPFERVQLVPSRHREWALKAAEKMGILREQLPAAHLEHIGSTAVPGLAAKDVVDLLVGVPAGSIQKTAHLLAGRGYDLEGDYAEHCWLSYPHRGARQFIVHIVEHRSRRWRRRIQFRDLLRSSEAARTRYLETKLAAAGSTDNWDDYTQSKTETVAALLSGLDDEPQVAGHLLAPDGHGAHDSARPSANDRVARAYDAKAGQYISLLGTVEQMHRLDRRRIGAWADLVEGHILDAGCGPGHWSDYLHRRGAQVCGIDLVEPFIKVARSRYPRIPFHISSFESLAARHVGCGGVLAWYSLIHLTPQGVPAVLSEFARSLAPGGRLLLGFFTGDALKSFDHAITTAYYWPIHDMADRLVDAGFEVVETETRCDPNSRPHASISAVLRSRPDATSQVR